MLTTEFFKRERVKIEEQRENKVNMDFKPSILHEIIQIKDEDVQFESACDQFSDEQNSTIKHNPSGQIEFVGIQDVKIENIDDYDYKVDPIRISEGTFTCDYCKRAFTTAEYCQKHIRRCIDRTYSQPSTAAALIPDKKPRLTNDGKKLYQCDKCNNTFKSYSGLYQHVRRHSRVGLHACNECHKQFTSLSNLDRHLLIHTGDKPHKCTQCDAAFNEASNLKTHMLTHTKSQTKPHKCSQCGQSFNRSFHLTTHLRTHTGEKPYLCTQCNKAFTRSSQLMSHMRTHMGEKPYQCAVCNQAFVHSCNLKSHMKTHCNERGNKP